MKGIIIMSKRSIFISHSSLDKDYGLAISNLFKEISEIKVFFLAVIIKACK